MSAVTLANIAAAYHAWSDIATIAQRRIHLPSSMVTAILAGEVTA